MPTFEVLGFNHTSFTVTDLDRPIAFFTEQLGFELKSRAPRGQKLIERLTSIPDARINVAFLVGHGHTMELIEYVGPAAKGTFLPPTCDAGASHVALNVNDMDAAVAASAAYGFEPMGEIIAIDAGPNEGRRVVYLRSPDGVTLEFLEVRGST